ncbi:MAG: hypothetical protein QXS81_03235 [Candidatus Micrarchaeaceae archaeon]
MPTKHNLTKYEKFVRVVNLISQRNEKEYSDNEKAIKNMAVLVACFSPNKSWRTYKILIDEGSQINKEELKQEYDDAKNFKWKNISILDLQEILTMPIKNQQVAAWLYYIVDPFDHETYRKAWENFDTILASFEEMAIRT